MSVTLTFNLEADFDRNGSYETALSSYTGRVSISRGMGRDGQYKVGQMSFGVRNDSATFTPEYTSSSLFGQLEPGVPVRLRITHNSIDYSLFAGYMKRTTNRWASGQVASADFTAQDLLAYLAGYSTTNVTVAERTTSAALTAIATNIGLSGGDYSFTGGQQTLPYHWSRNQDALSAMMDVVNSEMGGVLFADGDGVLQFQGRHARLGVTPDDTWGDTTTIYPSSIEYEVSDDNLISSVSIQANVFVLDDPNLVVFVASRNKDSTSFSLAAGETYEVELDYAQPITSLTTPVAQTDYQYNTASDGTGTDETANVDVTVTDLGAGFRLKLVNNSASTVYQMKFQLRGIPLNYVSDRPTFISELSIPGEKIDQSIAMLIPFADDDVQARNYSQGLLRTYRYPYPRLRLTIPWRDDDAAVAMLTAELGDLIKYTDRSVAVSRSSYVDDWWRIEALSHEVSASAGNTTQVTLVPSYLYFNLDAVLFDDFTRDNASGDLGTSLFGDVWANDSGFDIASNKARANTDTLSMATMELGPEAAVGTHSSGDVGSATTLTISHTVAVGTDVLAVSVQTRNGPVTGVTYGGVALTSAEAEIDSGIEASIWYLVDPEVGTDDVVVTATNTTAGIVAGATNLTDIDKSNPIRNTTTGSGSTSVSQAVTTVAGDIVIDSLAGPDNGTGTAPTVGANQTSLHALLETDTRGVSSWERATTTSTTMSWSTLRSENWRYAVVAFRGTEGVHDQVVEMNLAAIGTGDEVGGVLRYEDADNQVRFYLDKGSNELILEKNVATTVTEIASPAFTVGTTHELKAMVQGTRLRVYADRVLLIDETDGSLPSGTSVGIFARNANATTTFANFHARGLDV